MSSTTRSRTTGQVSGSDGPGTTPEGDASRVDGALPFGKTASGDEHPQRAPLSIHDMTVAYHRKPVLWDVDFDAPEGQLIGIVGPNGAGKSTLLKAVLDLVPKASGRVLIYGRPYRQQRSIVAYVPQRESVDWDFPVSALDVVAMGTYGKIGWVRPVRRRHRWCRRGSGFGRPPGPETSRRPKGRCRLAGEGRRYGSADHRGRLRIRSRCHSRRR